ncbi:MAG: leucine--tRNA ligase [bacterium]|nr:leucine--tRNA ligase [bacterium]
MKCNYNKIENKWMRQWSRNNYADWKPSDNAKKKKKYVLDMFPYPSGEGLHVGHVENYVATDIYSRCCRMKGFNVLHPMGWDAFGLPAENYAIKTKQHPAQVAEKNIKVFRKQIERLGLSYDWNREINTTDPKYYKWTQWIFLKLFEHGLAYEKEAPINWCPSCKTGLANEEVVDGKCDRCGTLVERKKLKQWWLKITAYAERLLSGLDQLDWPTSIKEMQRNWIGRSEGSLTKFKVNGKGNRIGEIEVFTTRADTLFGATYLVLSPEHPIINVLKNYADNAKEIDRYIDAAQQKSDMERVDPTKTKTGVEIKNVQAVNPANNQPISIWISDYVLIHYGTGAIMAVPAHDERDFEFAKKFGLKIIEVISPDQKEHALSEAYIGPGQLINSGPFNGLNSETAQDKISMFVGAKKSVFYKMRDWVFSRQRYWGEPIPIIKCSKCGNVPLSEKDLPLALPKVKSYEPSGTGESPLAAINSWVNTKCPKCGGPAKRETDTMPQWAGSCWYYLRYIDPKNNKQLVDLKKEKKWMPVDLYMGGAEHAVLHLLYARFWHKFLNDIGVVSGDEPFQKLVNQGLILGANNERMSKSHGNVANPDDIIKQYGADALRLYEMFMGPLQTAKPWNTEGINGVYRFLNRVWNLFSAQIKMKGKEMSNPTIVKAINQTIKKVTEDIENLDYNTAISALMECLNKLTAQENNKIKKSHLEDFLRLLAPLAPFLTEELWHQMNHKTSIHKEHWPKYNEKMLVEKEFELIIQINGKVRDKIKAAINISQNEAEKIAINREKIKQILSGKHPKKIIYVPNRLINIVI